MYGPTMSPTPHDPDALHRHLLGELASVGIAAGSIVDVMHLRRIPPAGIDVLVKHLSVPHSAEVMTHVVRCLADPNAKKYGLFEALIDEYIEMSAGPSADDRHLKEAYAVAAAYHATKSDIPLILYAVSRPGGMECFGHCLPKLRRFRCREAGPLLEEALRNVTTPESVVTVAKAMADVGWQDGLPVLRARWGELKGRARKEVGAAIERLTAPSPGG